MFLQPRLLEEAGFVRPGLIIKNIILDMQCRLANICKYTSYLTIFLC